MKKILKYPWAVIEASIDGGKGIVVVCSYSVWVLETLDGDENRGLVCCSRTDRSMTYCSFDVDKTE